MEEVKDKVEAPDNDNAQDPLNQTKETASSSVSSGTKELDKTKDSAKKSEPDSNVFDARKGYDELKANFDKTTKSYQELRRESTRWAQERSDFQKKLDTLADLLSKATDVPIDPAQFIRDLQAQGPKALEPHFNKWVTPIKDQYEKTIHDRDEQIFQLQRDFALSARRGDKVNYPDFEKLEETMKDIAEDNNSPVDYSKSPAEIYDTLYKLAKERNAEQAMRLAKEEGKKEAESRLAKEAASKIAGGGKSAGTLVEDWSKMSAEKMREVVAQLHGVADRD